MAKKDRTAQVRDRVKQLRNRRTAAGRRYLSVQVDEALLEGFRQACKTRGLRQAEAVEEALLRWLAATRVPVPLAEMACERMRFFQLKFLLP